MATPTLGSVPTTINAADVATGWTTFTTLDPDIKKEGSNSVSGILRTDLSNGYYQGSATPLANQHVRCWISYAALGALDTEANAGMEFFMYDGSATAYKTVFGSDTYGGGWKNIIVNVNDAAFNSLNRANIQRWGFRFNKNANTPRSVVNTWVDALRYGDGYYATGGTNGDEIDLAGISTLDATSAYGVIENINGVYFITGKLTIGNGATVTWFEMLGDVLVFTNSPVSSTLYGFLGNGAGARINIQGSVIRAAGTTDTTRFVFDMSEANLLSCSVVGSFIRRAGVSTFKAGQTITDNTFEDCGQIVAAGADMRRCVVKSPAVVADAGAISWNVATDPSGLLDNLQITKNASVAHHAITFGTTAPLSITLNNMNFSGFNAANSQNDSTFLVQRTTGNVTINVVNCTGNVTYKSAGATVTIVPNPVVLTWSANVSLVGAEVRVYDLDTTPPDYGTELAGAESCPTATYAYTGAAGNVIELQVMKSGYEEFAQIFTIPANSSTVGINLVPDRNA